jgi:hypothetical protein
MYLIKIHTILFIFAISLIIANKSYAQEKDTLVNIENYSDTTANKVKKEGKFFGFLKKSEKKKGDDDSDEPPKTNHDSIGPDNQKKKFKLSNLFKNRFGEDSLTVQNEGRDTIPSDSAENNLSDLNKNRNDSTDTIASRPKRLFPGMWNKMNREQQDSLLRAWDDYDREHFKEKKRFKFSRKDIEVAIKLKKDRNLYEKFIYNRARNKPFDYKKKLITRMNYRYRRTMWFERLDRSKTAPSDSMSDQNRYQIVNNQFKRQSKRETIRKNNVVIKYDKKEDRLRRRYELSENEIMLLNKGKAMPLSGADLLIHNKAVFKQERFSEKLTKMRRQRSFALQNEDMQKHMKEKNKMNKIRDKERYVSLFGKKRKKTDRKFNSYEYPERYEK